MASENNVPQLVASDQLLKAKDADPLLHRFFEEKITFLPTFKYDKNCDVYDTSKK